MDLLVADPKDHEQLVPEWIADYPVTLEHVLLKNLPMPPSSNNLYATIMIKGRPVRVKSKGLRMFEKEMAEWAMTHRESLNLAKEFAKKLQKGQVIEVHKKFIFNRSSIITLKNKPKKNDTSNRIKAIEDTLAKLIGIDDSYFWSGSYDKVGSTLEIQREFVDITLMSRYMV